MTESVDHQTHLQQLVQQEQGLSQEIDSKRNLLFKVRGAIEYLTEIGITLPQPEATTEAVSYTHLTLPTTPNV